MDSPGPKTASTVRRLLVKPAAARPEPSYGIESTLPSYSLDFSALWPPQSAGKTSHRLDPFLEIPWSRKRGDGWPAGGMASIFWSTEEGERNLTWEPTFVLQRHLTRLRALLD